MVRTVGGVFESEKGGFVERMETSPGVVMMLAAQTKRWRVG